MRLRLILLLGLLALAGSAVLWGRSMTCERDCATADEQADALFRRGELLAALTTLDEVDARCDCSRFTSGDAPPQYALAQACLRRLLGNGPSREVQDFLARVKGPILKELARQGANGSAK